MRLRIGLPSGIASLVVVLGCIPFAWGQTAPSFRLDTLLQLNDANPVGTETSPPGGTPRELFSAVPASGTSAQGMPRLPRTTPQLPGTTQASPRTAPLLRTGRLAVAAPARGASARSPETPLAFQRHPGRNLNEQDGSPAFILRSTSDAGVMMQIGLGIQSDTWHTDNLNNAKRSASASQSISELRPIVQLNLGSPPVGEAADSLRSEYYLELRYTPAQQTLLDAGTSRMLQRVAGEIGRASPVFTTAVRFEYDENIAANRGDGTVEDTGTVTEISPVIRYSLSAKTTFHVEGTWRRIAAQASRANRSEYILGTGITTANSPKTTLGAGLEFGHIPFDQAQFGAQDYEQAYGSMAWQPSPKIRFQTRAGIELRQFDQPVPKPARVTPVASVIVHWAPNDSTQINAGFLVRNQPSVSQLGATFREIRFGTDAKYQVGRNWYLRGEAVLTQRDYDSGTSELETNVRPAFGFHTDGSRLFDSLNFEIYYQFQRLDSNQRGIDRDRNIVGIESTLYF